MRLKTALFVGLIGAALFQAAPARADYVCSMHYTPASAMNNLVGGSYGDSGFFHANYYSGPDCTGTLTYSLYYCSLNATNSSCAAPGNSNVCLFTYLYNNAALMQLWAAHQQAQLFNQKVTPFPCTSTIGLAPSFWAN